MFGIGIGISSSLTQHKSSYTPEVVSYISGLTTPLSNTEKNLLNTLCKSLKTALSITSLDQAFDYLNIRAGETQEQSLRNFVKRANDSTAVNAPTWTKDEGFTGNGTSSYVEVDYIPSTGTNFTLNDASYGIYYRNFVRGAAKYNGAYSTTADGGASNRLLIGSIDPTYLMATINSGAVTVLDNNTTGLYIVNRLTSSVINWFRNKTKSANVASTSTKRPNQKMLECAARTEAGTVGLFNTSQIAFSFCAKGLTDAQHSGIVDAFEAYLDAKGKGVI
jgi:hypothetical protein